MDTVERILNSRRNIYLGGSGGTGKSFIIKEIMKRCNDGLTLCTASTGVAAIGVEGHTLHRALGLGLFKGSVQSLFSQMEKKKGLLKKWRSVHTLIIDEISMVDISVFVRASALMSLVRDDEREWGGIRLIISGDFLQLPPVDVYKEGGKVYKYLSKHPIWERLNLENILLDTPYRFVSQEHFDVLNDARFGILSDRLKETVEYCSRKPEKHPSGIIPTVVFSINKDVDAYNKAKLDKLPSEEVHFKATFRSVFRGEEIQTKDEIKERLSKDTHAAINLVLKVGAQVMLMVNTVDDSLCNGSRGIVTSFLNDNTPVVRFLNGLEIPIKQHSWTTGTPKEVGGDLEWENHRMTQLPLRLAYAVTAHKTQGVTLDSAYLCVDRCFVPNHIYVMLSRCKDPRYMYISGWSDEKFHECAPDKEIVDFYRNMEA